MNDLEKLGYVLDKTKTHKTFKRSWNGDSWNFDNNKYTRIIAFYPLGNGYTNPGVEIFTYQNDNLFDIVENDNANISFEEFLTIYNYIKENQKELKLEDGGIVYE